MALGAPSTGDKMQSQMQTCKVCGRRDKFDYHVSDETWAAVVPPRFLTRVVCLSCFDDYALEKGVDYSAEVCTLYFAGDAAVFEFRPARAVSTSSFLPLP
jgi:hypothetical protein